MGSVGILNFLDEIEGGGDMHENKIKIRTRAGTRTRQAEDD